MDAEKIDIKLRLTDRQVTLLASALHKLLWHFGVDEQEGNEEQFLLTENIVLQLRDATRSPEQADDD